VAVTPKLTSSTDTSWFGLAKYAWSGYVSFIVCMLLGVGKWQSDHVQEITMWICLWYTIAPFVVWCFERCHLATHLS
jgi:hypothetical protein